MRRISPWAAADSTPVSMVRQAMSTISSCTGPASGLVAGNIRLVNRRITATPTLVSSPANTAEITGGGVWYEAGSQAKKGNAAALIRNATSSTAATGV